MKARNHLNRGGATTPDAPVPVLQREGFTDT